MKTLPDFRKGGLLQAETLTALVRNIERTNLAAGKGVLSGLDMTPGTGLSVNVSAGEFQASAHDSTPAFSVPLPPNKFVYVWIEANDEDNTPPNADWTEAATDYGTNWVCLGRVTTGENSVSIDPSKSGRQTYGSKLGGMTDLSGYSTTSQVEQLIADAPPSIPQDVTLDKASLKTITLTDAATGEEADLFAQIDPDGNMALYIRRENGDVEPYQSRFRLHIHPGPPPTDGSMGRTNDIYLNSANGDWWQRRNGAWVPVGNGWPPLLSTATINSSGHLVLSLSDGTTVDAGSAVGKQGDRGTIFWGGYATVAAMPKAADGVNGGDLAFNQGNSSLYTWASGSWANIGSLKGDPGTNGLAPTVAIGTVSSLAAGASATASITGTSPNLSLSLGIPKGDKGDTGSSGLLTASAPLAYDATAKSVSLPAATTTAPGHMTAAQATTLNDLNTNKTLRLLNQSFVTAAIGLLGSPTLRTFTLPGATVGMGVIVNPRNSSNLGPLLYGWVSAANTVSVEVRALVALGAETLAIDIHVIP